MTFHFKPMLILIHVKNNLEVPSKPMVIHFGSPKAGSTSLQLEFAKLESSEVALIDVTPSSLRFAKYGFLQSTFGLPPRRSRRFPLDGSGECLHKQLESKRRPSKFENKILVFSREDMGYRLANQFAKTATAISECSCDSKILGLFLVRDPVAAAISAYFQFSIFKSPIPSFESELSNPDFRSKLRWVSHYEVMEALGVGPIRVNYFMNPDPANLLESLLSDLKGEPVPRPGRVSPRHSNESITESSFRLLRKLRSIRRRLALTAFVIGKFTRATGRISKPLVKTLSEREHALAVLEFQEEYRWLDSMLSPHELEMMQAEHSRVAIGESVWDYVLRISRDSSKRTGI